MPDDAALPEDPAGTLFGLDPGEFVAARNALVRSLRKDGRREEAAAVAGLRRPGPAAWAVNQLSRRRAAELDGLVELGQALRDAQARALEGADAQVLRQAGRARRDAVGALADIAVALLAERGAGGDGHAGEIVATLEAASLDAASGDAVLAGRLTAALQPPSGFGDDGAGPTMPPTPRAPQRSEPDAGAEAEVGVELRRRLEQARRAATEAGQLATRLAADAATVAGTVGTQEDGLRRARDRVAALEKDLDAARHDADFAAEAVNDALAAVAEAEAAATDARQRVADAEARVAALEE